MKGLCLQPLSYKSAAQPWLEWNQPRTTKAYPRVNPEVCDPATLWMMTGWEVWHSDLWYPLISCCWLTDESLSVNCELEPSHETSCTMETHTWMLTGSHFQTNIYAHKGLYSSCLTTLCSYSQHALFFSNKVYYPSIISRCNLLLHFHEYFSDLSQIQRWKITCFSVNLQSMATN